jgi:hypothetical protein
MPVILETIDAIARRLKRDVIFLAIVERQDRPSRDRPEVAEATQWLDEEGLGWTPCFGFMPGMVIFEGGPRAIHIDAPFEPESPLLRRLEDRFETPDGLPRHPDLVLSLLRLETAMVNEDQDEPGFWDNF